MMVMTTSMRMWHLAGDVCQKNWRYSLHHQTHVGHESHRAIVIADDFQNHIEIWVVFDFLSKRRIDVLPRWYQRRTEP